MISAEQMHLQCPWHHGGTSRAAPSSLAEFASGPVLQRVLVGRAWQAGAPLPLLLPCALHEQQLANLPFPAVTADHLSRPAAFGSIGFAYLSKDKIVRRSVQWWRWRTSHCS